MPAAGAKGAPKCPGELKDDTSSAREEKQVCDSSTFIFLDKFKIFGWRACTLSCYICIDPLWCSKKYTPII